MGFFSGIGEALFGTETKAAGQKAAKEGGNAAKAVSSAAGAMGKKAGQEAAYYDNATKKSMGGSAGEFMQKANVAAQGQAEQAGTAAATQGTQAALRAARSSGLNKGQAALTAGQQAGDIYSNTYQSGLESGRNQYQSMAGNMASQGAQMAGRQQNALGTQLGAAQTQAGIGAQQQQAAAATSAGTWGTIGTIAGAALMSDESAKSDIFDIGKAKSMLDRYKLSDENAKESVEEVKDDSKSFMENATKLAGSSGTAVGEGFAKGAEIGKAIKEKGTLSDCRAKDIISDGKNTLDSLDVLSIAKKIRPVTFKYKKEIIKSGKASDGDKFGVIAQDLEKTPLAEAVIKGEDGLKRIDTAELTPALLNMVVQLATEVSRLKGDK